MSKLAKFTDEEILQEYNNRRGNMKIVASQAEIKNAKLGEFTYKDVVISYPRKEQFQEGDVSFFFFFKRKSGELVDIYSAISEVELTDEEEECDAYTRMCEFIPLGADECCESTYELDIDIPHDYDGFIKTSLDYLRKFGYENFIESKWDN